MNPIAKRTVTALTVAAIVVCAVIFAPLTAIIMEATNGDLDEDFRMFVHSGVKLVARTVNMLKKTGRYKPPAGQKAYLTHLAIKYRDWPAEKINAELPDPLAAAYDGFELMLG